MILFVQEESVVTFGAGSSVIGTCITVGSDGNTILTSIIANVVLFVGEISVIALVGDRANSIDHNVATWAAACSSVVVDNTPSFTKRACSSDCGTSAAVGWTECACVVAAIVLIEGANQLGATNASNKVLVGVASTFSCIQSEAWSALST